MIIDILMIMISFLCSFSLHFICLKFASFLTAYLLLAFAFSTLPFMTRVWRFNARKDCLVCIVGVIAGGHYDQGRDCELQSLLLLLLYLAVLPVPSICLTAYQD